MAAVDAALAGVPLQVVAPLRRHKLEYLLGVLPLTGSNDAYGL
jgi:hypothetical protein